MTRCAIAVGAGMAALHLLPQTAGFAVTNHLLRFVQLSEMASSHISSSISNLSEVQP